MAAAQHPPVQPLSRSSPLFISGYTTALIMKDQTFSIPGNAFTIKTLDGCDVLKITADTLSLSARKRVYDPASNHVFTLRKEIFSIPKSFFGESPTGSKIFEVEGKFHFGSSHAV